MKFIETVDNYKDERRFLDLFSPIGTELSDAQICILRACHKNPGLSPNVTAKTEQEVVTKWHHKYQKGYDGRISKRKSNVPGTVSDPIVDTIIGARLDHLTSEQLKEICYAHRISMSAENILGLLLEEYLAKHLSKYGWYCCWGDIVRHVDFCHKDGKLLQVKNRSNSENSSSSRVRINQPIDKWHRVDARTGDYMWDRLNNDFGCNLSEDAFQIFVTKTLKSNTGALPVETENPWKG